MMTRLQITEPASWSTVSDADTTGQERRDDGGAPRRISDHIGGRIRQRRTELGLTQEQLAQALGISYQQVQKYETGANRVSASRLYELAQEFGVAVSYFYEGFELEATGGPLPHGGHNRTAIDLVRNFLCIEDEALRGAVSGLLKALREQREEVAARDQSPATTS